MAATEFIVAIELGSSKISGIAGRKLPDGSIQVLATANENASGCIRKGVIYNLDKQFMLRFFTNNFFNQYLCIKIGFIIKYYDSYFHYL